MRTLIGSCVWIDFFHPKSSRALRQLAADYIDREDALICEPIFTEICQGLPANKAERVIEHLATVPMLPTSGSLWRDAAELIRICTSKGQPVGTLDAVIAGIAKQSGSTLVTFDSGFSPFRAHCGVEVLLLKHPH